MNKHTKAINCLIVRDSTLDIMKLIHIQRDKHTSMAFNLVMNKENNLNYTRDLEFIKLQIQLCDDKFNIYMAEYLDAMSYLEEYNDEFNQSKKWKKWMYIRNLRVLI